jgi:hypothetical protein
MNTTTSFCFAFVACVAVSTEDPCEMDAML